MTMMLTERYGRLDLSQLALNESNLPFPPASNREAWESLPEEARRFWIAEAEQALAAEWPQLPASRYLAAKRTGKITAASDPVFERRTLLGKLVIGECAEGRGRFLESILDGIISISEETTWGSGPSEPGEWLPAPEDQVVDLISAETAALFAWTSYLLRASLDELSPRIVNRMAEEVRRRVLQPYLEQDDAWWMGFRPGVRVNNWNPWCNTNVLASFLLFEPDALVRARGIRKIFRSLDCFIDTHPPDGCCDEGPMYWEHSGGKLFDILDLLYRASGGKIDLFGEKIVRDMGAYIYKVHIDGDYYANFADCDARMIHYPDVLFGYGERIGDGKLMRFGASVPLRLRDHPYWFHLYRYARELFQRSRRAQTAAAPPYVRDAWFERTQVMTARTREGSREGLFLAAKGGHNAESHSHNDVGNFIVYADGLPVLIDLGTEEYRAQTFSPNRFDIWVLQSSWHNLPTVRGVQQRDGKSFAAAREATYRCSDELAELALDIAGAYPLDAGIARWRRTYRLHRGREQSVEIVDDYRLAEPTDDVRFSLVSICRPEEAGDGAFLLEYAAGRKVKLTYDAGRLTATVETVPLLDSRLRRNWPETAYRIVLRLKRAESSGTCAVRILYGEEFGN